MVKHVQKFRRLLLSLHINKNYGHQIWIENSLGANLKVIDEIIMAISGGTVKIL